jgi:steroid 5-alpha reductase family enzyme
MTLWFILASLIKRNDVADIAWGLGFILVAVSAYVIHTDHPLGVFVFNRSSVATLLVALWGSRLAYHIFKRNIHKPEDKRYAAWRAAWGNHVAIISFFQIFMLQGILLLLIVTPVVIINSHQSVPWTALDIVGILVWFVGFFFESTGDRQLRTFLANPDNKGKILETGLWKYTRHPNYFGEVTQWWGLWIVALSVPNGVWGIIGPLTITFLIVKVSGIPMLEKSMAANPLFNEYCMKTPTFIPFFRWWK